MKKILVPTDFSKQANHAFKAAVKLAEINGAEINLLHVIDVPIPGSFSPTGTFIPTSGFDQVYVIKLVEKVKKDMEKLAATTKIKVHKRIDFDRAHNKIAEFVTQHKMDMVVMGSKGTSGLSGMLIGSNTEKVVRTLDVPVLTIKADPGEFKVKNIVFASSFSDKLVGVMDNFKAFAKVTKANIHMVKVNTPNNFQTSKTNMAMIEKFAKKFGIDKYTAHIYDDITEEDGILNFAEFIKADLVAMATHGRTGIAHLLNGSIAEDLVNSSKKPVLTFKTQI